MSDPAHEIGDDELIALSKAAEIFFRGELTKSSLRTEARKGQLGDCSDRK